jgi:hypothetical protein
MSDDYFCLAADGDLWALGSHGDFESAESAAESMELTPVWVFGSTTAKEWRDFLNEKGLT